MAEWEEAGLLPAAAGTSLEKVRVPIFFPFFPHFSLVLMRFPFTKPFIFAACLILRLTLYFYPPKYLRRILYV